MTARHGIRSWEEREQARLAARFPDWDIWYVPCYQAPTAWCAKPKGHPVATINVDSPDELEFTISAQH